MISKTMKNGIWTNKRILVTGGTGFFGRRLVEYLCFKEDPLEIVVFSRDELKQHTMKRAGFPNQKIRYCVGDVRDASSLRRAMIGVDIVIHAAALKQVATSEDNPLEFIHTNVLGTKNVVDSALEKNVAQLVLLSTDKAVHPFSVYGATKLLAERLVLDGNAVPMDHKKAFSVLRHGNVVASRGSVIEMLLDVKGGPVRISDAGATRFWISVDQCISALVQCVSVMRGGEVFVPKAPSMKIGDVVDALRPGYKIEETGLERGEKRHEVLISEEEAPRVVELGTMYVIKPDGGVWLDSEGVCPPSVGEGFSYTSSNNVKWLNHQDLQFLLRTLEGTDRNEITLP